MKPKILALETASERCSVALQTDTGMFVRESEQPRGHAALILTMVNEVLGEAQLSLSELDALAFSKGPGAFTSIRIGTSVVQGLALGADLPVVGISSLEIMAQTLANEHQGVVFAALDARMHEVYFGVYQITGNTVTALQDDQVVLPAEVKLSADLDISEAIAIGSGWHVYQQELAARFSKIELETVPEHYPHARDLVTIATRYVHENRVLSVEQVLPVYIRDKVTHGS